MMGKGPSCPRVVGLKALTQGGHWLTTKLLIYSFNKKMDNTTS